MTNFKLAAAILFSVCSAAVGQTSFWANSVTPGTKYVTNDNASVTLGLKFRSTVAGKVTAVRFYKGSGNTGTHVGNLWSSSGTKLGSVTFSGETASGWQEAQFSSPIAIAANTTYVVSYLAPRGAYAINESFAWSSLSASPLQVSGTAPGVYRYGSSASFPNAAWNGSNYWVDLVFVANGTPNPSPTYTISGRVTGSAATLTLSGTASKSTSTDGAGNYTFSGLSNGSYVVAASRAGYTFAPATAAASVHGVSVTGLNFAGTPVAQPVPHSVTLSWAPSTSSGIRGYNVYRSTVPGGSYVKLNGSPMASTSYSDGNVASGMFYYYVATTIDNNNSESAYSNEAAAAVPTP
jgi:hypothetical protein